MINGALACPLFIYSAVSALLLLLLLLLIVVVIIVILIDYDCSVPQYKE